MSPPVRKVESDTVLPNRADVVVIGGGIAGSSAAYFLAKKGLSVALVEKGCIAGEQSSRNWGWCRQQNRAYVELDLAKRSLELWDDLKAVGDTGFRRTGLVMVTNDESQMAQWQLWADKAREHQIHSRILTAAEVAERVPGCTEKWIGGLSADPEGRGGPPKAAAPAARAARPVAGA